MQLLRRHQDSWLTMQWFRPCQPTIREGRDWNTPDSFPIRPGSCRPWSEDSWSKTQVEVCSIPVGPKSGYFLFEPWDFICSNLFPNQVISFLSLEISFVQIFFQPSGPEDVEQGEPDQPDHHVDGEGGEGGEGGDVGDDAEAAAGLHFFSLTKSTGLLSCCNLLFLFKARSDHTPLQPWCLPNGPSLSQAKREGLLFLLRQELQGQVK